jgi:hypothetical protein
VRVWGGGELQGVSLLITILHTSTNTAAMYVKKMRMCATPQERDVWVLKGADPIFQNVMDSDLT